MSASDRGALKAGIAPPPFSTCFCTVAASGFSWSRSGPTCPLVPASASVWQAPQLAVKTGLPAAASPGAPPAVELEPDEPVVPPPEEPVELPPDEPVELPPVDV